MTKTTSRLLDEMLETGRDLHQANLIDRHKLGEIDSLACVLTDTRLKTYLLTKPSTNLTIDNVRNQSVHYQ